MRAVLDASVYVSGALRPEGPAGRVLELVVARAVVAVTSPAVADQVLAALRQPAVRRALGPRFDAEGWFAAMQLLGVVVPDRDAVTAAAGDAYLSAARIGLASHLVTLDTAAAGDASGPRRMTPAQFLRELGA